MLSVVAALPHRPTSLLALLLVALLPHAASAQTNVSGVIGSNTTWTLAGSPYTVAGNVLVNPGVTLTIEPGVSVRYSTSVGILIRGAIVANGTPDTPIVFSRFNSTSSDLVIMFDANLSDSLLSHLRMSRISLRLGNSSAPCVSCTGTLTATDTEIDNSFVYTTGNSAASLVFDRWIMRSVVIEADGEPITIRNSQLLQSRVEGNVTLDTVNALGSTLTGDFSITACMHRTLRSPAIPRSPTA